MPGRPCLALPAVFSTSLASHFNNCSDTAINVAKAMIGVEVITLCFTTFALFLEFHTRTHPQDLQPYLTTETGLKFLLSAQGEIGPSSQASQVNWAHVKRP